MVLYKRRAVVAAHLIFLVLSPDVLLIAHASRDSGRKKTSSIMEPSHPTMGEMRMSANLQFKDAGDTHGYTSGTVELLWDEANRVISLVNREAVNANPLWKSSVDTDSPPSITMKTDPHGIFTVSLMDYEKKSHLQLRANRVGAVWGREFNGDGSKIRRSKAQPMKIAVANNSLFAGDESNTVDMREDAWAGRLTSVLQVEVSLKFGAFLCLIAGTCVQPCMAPQCGGSDKHCECVPRGFCNLEGKKCVPVTTEDSYSSTPDLDELLRDQNAISVSNMTIKIQGEEKYLIRNESGILNAFEKAMETVSKHVSEVERTVVKSIEEEAKEANILMYANMLLSMVQHRELIRHTLPWTYDKMCNSAPKIESWVRSLQTGVQQRAVMSIEKKCGVVLGDGTQGEAALLHNLDTVEARCANDQNFSSALQLARGGALIDGDQGTQAHASSSDLLVLTLVFFAMGVSFTVVGAVLHYYDNPMGTYFLTAGGICFVVSGVLTLPSLLIYTASAAGKAALASYPTLKLYLLAGGFLGVPGQMIVGLAMVTNTNDINLNFLN